MGQEDMTDFKIKHNSVKKKQHQQQRHPGDE